jgi:hypothetical protein
MIFNLIFIFETRCAFCEIGSDFQTVFIDAACLRGAYIQLLGFHSTYLYAKVNVNELTYFNDPFRGITFGGKRVTIIHFSGIHLTKSSVNQVPSEYVTGRKS